MIIQNRDGSLVHDQRHLRSAEKRRPDYRADIPAILLDERSSLIDQIISFAFDTLGAMRLDLRVREAE